MTFCKVCNQEMHLYIEKAFDDRYGYPEYFDIFSCENCGLYQIYPPLKQSEIANLYTHYYPRENIELKKIKENFQPEQGRFLKFQKWLEGNHRIQYMLVHDNKKILEIGCGDGRSLLQLQALGYDVYGIETDENMKKAQEELGLNMHIGTIENCGFTPKTFDYIIANQLIEHIINLDSFIESCKTLLKDDGSLIFSTPNSGSLYRKLCGKKWVNWHIPYHQQIFSNKSLGLLLKKHNLEIISIKTITPMTWTLHQIHSLRTNQTMGIKNPYWNKKQNTNNSKKQVRSFKKNAIFILKRFRYNLTVLCINICNRFVDFLNQGDCLIVTIKKTT